MTSPPPLLRIPFFCLIVLLIFLACSSNSSSTSPPQETTTPSNPTTTLTPPPDLELKAYQNENGTWGYDVFLNGKRYIHQPDKPAVGGRKGFDSRAQAEAVGELVMQKIAQGIMPPSVSAAEVDSLVRLTP